MARAVMGGRLVRTPTVEPQAVTRQRKEPKSERKGKGRSRVSEVKKDDKGITEEANEPVESLPQREE